MKKYKKNKRNKWLDIMCVSGGIYKSQIKSQNGDFSGKSLDLCARLYILRYMVWGGGSELKAGIRPNRGERVREGQATDDKAQQDAGVRPNRPTLSLNVIRKLHTSIQTTLII